MKPKQLLNKLARERGLECCHDGACIYGHPGGMQTNGGCQAMKERDATTLRRHVQALRSIALELAVRVINERKLYLVPTDPADVVAELRAEADGIEKRSQNTYTRDMIMALTHAADLVAEKLGVKP